jgi:hypothetical protein
MAETAETETHAPPGTVIMPHATSNALISDIFLANLLQRHLITRQNKGAACVCLLVLLFVSGLV